MDSVCTVSRATVRLMPNCWTMSSAEGNALAGRHPAGDDLAGEPNGEPLPEPRLPEVVVRPVVP